jgi:SAM-dependent methyltransferase
MEPGRSFDSVAGLYAEVRPGYPAALFDDLVRVGGLTSAASVLEVGCGAGQATGDLAARAGRLTALDPGASLIAEAKRRAALSNVTFAVATFEDLLAPSGSFDLIASAQAWHWVDPKVAFAKAADLLTADGRLAVFGHVPMPVREPFADAFRKAFDRHAPGAWGTPHPMAWYLQGGPVPAMFAASGRFGAVTHRGYAWTWTVDAATLGKYLRTDSAYRFLPEADRFALFDEMTGAVEAAGNAFPMAWETHLYLAQKLERAPQVA